jgi:glycosyltransferase involved in cell wall biosynthesis
MVVVEAMAIGLPVIVSNRVGAKCVIEEYPGSGWILPFNMNAFQEKIIELSNNRELLIKSSNEAKLAVENYSWDNYRIRVVKVLEEIYACNSITAA